jgi:3-oxoacyl-[acyl-carrier-protein] synthase-3
VYGLALAEGLIRTGAVGRVLLLTAETYSKYIHPEDRSLRTIFGDAAAATLIEPADRPSLRGFRFGTDGTGADTLLVRDGGARPPQDAIEPRHRQRWESKLYMDGPALINFTMWAVPELIQQVLNDCQIRFEDVDFFLLHQATRKMLEKLHERLKVGEDRLPIDLDRCGNTVSSTIPILIDDMRRDGRLRLGHRSVLVGFGVGLSWAGCLWEETWSQSIQRK